MSPQRPLPDVTVVTGAAGWLGSALLDAFAAVGPWQRPTSVRALVRDAAEAERVRAVGGANVVPVIGDVTRPETLAALFDGIGGDVDVIHAAGVIHPSSTAEFDAVNARGTANVVAAAEAAGVRRLVHVSSNSPFGTNPDAADRFRADEPYHPYLGYGRSKMDAELAVLAGVDRGLDAVIVRPPWFYGPHQPLRQTTFFRMVRRGRFPVLGRGDQVRSMVFIGNLVQGVCRAELTLTEPGRGWWIADARPYRVAEIVETVGRALRDEGLDVAPNRLRVPAIVGRWAEAADTLLQRSGRYVQQLHVLGEMDKHIACDVSAATQELGYEPETELYDGMRASIRWCLDRGVAL